MKIVVPFEEVTSILETYLRDMKQLQVKSGTGQVVSHVEGQYDEQEKVVDGISFEL